MDKDKKIIWLEQDIEYYIKEIGEGILLLQDIVEIAKRSHEQQKTKNVKTCCEALQKKAQSIIRVIGYFYEATDELKTLCDEE